MSYSNVVNTAEQYFKRLGTFILDEFIKSGGIISPAYLSRYIQKLGIILTQTAIKAHNWVLKKLTGLVNEIEDPGNPLKETNVDYIETEYKSITHSEYIKSSHFDLLEGAMERWTKRAEMYELKNGGINDAMSAIYCQRKVEQLAWAMAKGCKAIELETPAFEQYLDETIGKVDYSLIDPSLKNIK